MKARNRILKVAERYFRFKPIDLYSCSFVLFVVFFPGFFNSLSAADKIVLRNLELLRDCSVVSFDADGLVLAAERPSGGKLVTWDEVESLELTSQQSAAAKQLAELGPALYAIQRRLITGDDEALLAPAEKMWPIFRERQGKSACVVALALMWGRLAHGRREEAVQPWLKAYELMRTRVLKVSEIPGKRKLLLDASTALNWELEPVWFDAAAAKQALPELDAFIATMREPIPEGAKLYLASLALAAQAEDIAQPMLEENFQQEKAVALQKILLVQQALLVTPSTPSTTVEELQRWLANLPADLQPLALYWLGQAGLASTTSQTRDEAFVHLLRIPALHARHSPDLAAAALFATLEHYRDDRRLSARLRQEILEKFPATFHAKRLSNAPATSPVLAP